MAVAEVKRARLPNRLDFQKLVPGIWLLPMLRFKLEA